MTPAPFYFIPMENNQTNIPKKRILVLADFACNTGFGNVAQNIVSQILLEERVDYWVDVVGINYYGEPNTWQRFYPKVRLFSASMSSRGDLWGREYFLELASSGEYDYLWVLQDTFIVKTIAKELKQIHEMLPADKKFTWIYYFPLDATPPDDWITDAVAAAHIPVSYTKWAKGLCTNVSPELESKIEVIPHGVDTGIFNVLDPDEVKVWRTKYFHGHADGRVLLTNVNRNQPRKDIGRTLQVAQYMKKIYPGKYLFYMHMKPKDVGVDVVRAATSMGLEMYKDYVIPNKQYDANKFPASLLNYVYNASDAIISTALGEGWGLSLTEAMATKTPVFAPNHTAVADVCNYGSFATLCAASNEIIIANDNEVIRKQTDIVDMAQKIDAAFSQEWSRKTMNSTCELAYKHVVSNLDWNTVGQAWRDLLFRSTPNKSE